MKSGKIEEKKFREKIFFQIFFSEEKKSFFKAQFEFYFHHFQIENLKKGSRFEEEIKAEQEQLRQAAEEKKVRRNDFKQKAALFTAGH